MFFVLVFAEGGGGGADKKHSQGGGGGAVCAHLISSPLGALASADWVSGQWRGWWSVAGG